jgi:PII-like signaling protein
MIADALKLSVYFGESVAAGAQPASEVLMASLARRGLVCTALLRGIEGFGINRRIHAQRFPDVSTDLPLLAVAVDEHDRIRDALTEVDEIVPRGLVTLEQARLATGRDVATATFPDGPGRAAKLTIYCAARERVRGRPAYREAVAVLRRHGATGAIVLPGVDGVLGGRRQRATLFGRSGNAPMIIISVGPPELLRPALAHLGELFAEPVVTLEGIAQVKHDGELLEPPPSVADGLPGEDVWRTIRVYTRRVAQVDGRALYSELTRRLREVGAAGATTILGDWGFSSDEHPHGDKLGRIASHRPTYTVYIDRAEKVAEVWPLIDEMTAEHGIVTSLIVPGYRERAGEAVNGRLDAAEDLVSRWRATRERFPEPPPAAALERAPWLAELMERVERFSRARGGRAPVVRITLADDERFFLYAIEPGPGDDFLTLHPHPERHGDAVQTSAGPVPPRAVVVPRTSIVKIELLTKPPRGTRSLVTLHRRPPD